MNPIRDKDFPGRFRLSLPGHRKDALVDAGDRASLCAHIDAACGDTSWRWSPERGGVLVGPRELLLLVEHVGPVGHKRQVKFSSPPRRSTR